MRIAIIFFGWMVFSLPAVAQEAPKDVLLKEAGWLELLFDGKKPNTFAAQSDGAIVVGSDESVSLLYKPLDVDLAKTPKLSWSWKVDKSVPVTDLSVKGKDDRSLALYVSFPFDYERAGFWERFTRDLVVAFKGEDTPGRVISYVWGGDEEPGAIIESPYLKSAGALIALQKAGTSNGQWFEQQVDVAKDYERIFGEPANKPYQIAISADSDDSKVMSLGWVKNIRFE
ncbi:DUF3047 domain-containing protein [Terasakiella sp. A23]|uniref:DUF3047 domain-containing protein n=1 Tax=Terasakiella sp. FCG-A23 TaxID=3080561 RepID=UPI002953F7F1|nr:DUF3047 domain-containing protein [Terasakiella sp. A23]MDV7340192.1 DUF3047 domain-containing protein [Terasakiella sp. A23]